MVSDLSVPATCPALCLYQRPALLPGNRRAFLDPYLVADLGLVGLVMGVIALAPAHGLLHHRVRKTALDQDDNGLVVLVADDGSLKYSLRHLISPCPRYFAGFSCFCCAMVLMRAMSRRT